LLLFGLDPAKVVMSVDANFSKIVYTSSDLICGANVEVVGTEVDVEAEPKVCKFVACEVAIPAKTNFATAFIRLSAF
jgi:hypothetical protein